MRLIELHQCLQIEAIAQHLVAIQGFMPLGRIVIEKADYLIRLLRCPQTTEDEGSGIACPKDEHPPLLLLSNLRPALPLADQAQPQTHRCHADKEAEPINEQYRARERTKIKEKRQAYKEKAAGRDGFQDIPYIRIRYITDEGTIETKVHETGKTHQYHKWEQVQKGAEFLRCHNPLKAQQMRQPERDQAQHDIGA